MAFTILDIILKKSFRTIDEIFNKMTWLSVIFLKKTEFIQRTSLEYIWVRITKSGIKTFIKICSNKCTER